MRLGTDDASRNLLEHTILSYYRSAGRECMIVKATAGEDGAYACSFFVDRAHVMRYDVGPDRGGICTGMVSLGFGPAFLAPNFFLSYENFLRFQSIATTEAICRNLQLVDEYLATRK